MKFLIEIHFIAVFKVIDAVKELPALIDQLRSIAGTVSADRSNRQDDFAADLSVLEQVTEEVVPESEPFRLNIPSNEDEKWKYFE